MRLYKEILNQAWAQNAVSAVAAAYLKLVQALGRWEFRGSEIVQSQIDQQKPIILCFWHSRLVANAFGWKFDKPLHQLSTPHRDGKLAAATYNRMGVKTIWGSTSKGGSQAVRGMLKILKAGGIVAITPDGPRGPRGRMQKSAIDLARLSGAVLIPVSNSFKPFKMLNTWDRMLVPVPFSSGIFKAGEAIEVPRKATEEELEAIRQQVEDQLNALTFELDLETGVPTPEPAPVTSSGQADGGAE